VAVYMFFELGAEAVFRKEWGRSSINVELK